MLIKPLPKKDDKEVATLHVPEDQAWLLHILSEQTKILKSINTAIQIIAVIILLSVIVAACSALLS
jgi:hypothetical protein